METFSNIKNTLFRGRPIIFIVTGTQAPFDRLLTILDNWTINDNYDIIAQTAKSDFKSEKMTCFAYLEPDVFDNYFLHADIVIGHAGMGTIIKALENEKKLVVFPRLIKYNEHRNEHQYHTAKSLERLGYLNVAFTEKDLLEYLNNPQKISVRKKIDNKAEESLISRISDFITQA
jgi:UDP-N-acetylglucosamine transferase subunit ALG13